MTMFLTVKTWLTFSHSNILIHTQRGDLNCGFCPNFVILESISPFVISMWYKKSARTPWRWRRQTPKCVGVK